MEDTVLGQADIPGLVALSAELQWDYAPAELETALAAGTLIGHKGPDGELRACAGLFPYGDRLTSLGMVMVSPRHQGRGHGKRLTQACMAMAGERPVILAATEAGMYLYDRLGFRTVGTLHKLIHPGLQASGAAVWAGEEPTADELLRLDAGALGVERTAFLRARRSQAADATYLRNSEGRLTGYGFGVQGPLMRVLGPIVAPDAASALALVAQLTARHAGRYRIDVPSEHEDVIQDLRAQGFELDRIVPVMALHIDKLPPRNGTLFAIAAQAYG